MQNKIIIKKISKLYFKINYNIIIKIFSIIIKCKRLQKTAFLIHY